MNFGIFFFCDIQIFWSLNRDVDFWCRKQLTSSEPRQLLVGEINFISRPISLFSIPRIEKRTRIKYLKYNLANWATLIFIYIYMYGYYYMLAYAVYDVSLSILFDDIIWKVNINIMLLWLSNFGWRVCLCACIHRIHNIAIWNWIFHFTLDCKRRVVKMSYWHSADTPFSYYCNDK